MPSKGLFMVCLATISGAGVPGCLQSATLPPSASISSAPRQHVPGDTRFRPLGPGTVTPSRPSGLTMNPWKPTVTERDWKHIVIHHTASSGGSVASIDESHRNRKDKAGNPWLGIGYHFVIGNGQGMGDGEIEPTFRWKQQMHGAHAGVEDYNQHGIGIVLVGNFEKEPPSPAQLAAVKRLVGVLKADYGINSDHVVGHGSVKATACPGKYFPLAEVTQSLITPSFTNNTSDFAPGRLASVHGRRNQ